MANSKGFLGDENIGVFKLGDSDVKLYLGDMLVYPLSCEDDTFYRIVGQPIYPSTIKGNDTSFGLNFDWEQVHIDTGCTESIVDSGNEDTNISVGINPSTANSRDVSGSYSFNGLSVPYNVTLVIYLQLANALSGISFDVEYLTVCVPRENV